MDAALLRGIFHRGGGFLQRDGLRRSGGEGDAPGVGVQVGVGPRGTVERNGSIDTVERPVGGDCGRGILQDHGKRGLGP